MLIDRGFEIWAPNISRIREDCDILSWGAWWLPSEAYAKKEKDLGILDFLKFKKLI